MDAFDKLGDAFGDLGDGVKEVAQDTLDYVKDMFGIVDKAVANTSGQFSVTPANVLAAAKIIGAQADDLRSKVVDASDQLKVAPPGEDEVSVRMAKAWNALLVDNDDSYKSRAQQYVDGLTNLVTQLQESARTYGYTEDEIAAALGKTSG